MLGLFLALFVAVFVPSAESVASLAGKPCPYGCIVGQGIVYALDWSDVVALGRVTHCEVGSHLDTRDAPAALWALSQNFVRTRIASGRDMTFGGFVLGYSACASKRWSSEGDRYNARITPRADRNWRLRWRELPVAVRRFVVDFLRDRIPNETPGYVYVLTAGWERAADRRWIGPHYQEPDTGRSRNAYYQDRTTEGWTTLAVRIAPARTDERRVVEVELPEPSEREAGRRSREREPRDEPRGR